MKKRKAETITWGGKPRGILNIKIDPETGCHNFQGAKTRNGYGRLKVQGEAWMAHRYALSKHLGRPIREGLVVMHLCDNPACVNPEHLREGTQWENMEDCKKKGRMYRPGAKKPHTGPWDASLKQYKRRFNSLYKQVMESPLGNAQIANELGVRLHWVRLVRRGKLSLYDL